MSLGTKRKSWVAASCSRRTANSQASADDVHHDARSRSRTSSPKTRSGKQAPLKATVIQPGPRLKPSKGKVSVANEKENKDMIPKSSIARRRPQSAPSKRPIRPSPEEAKAPLGQFSKSLKLLGVEIPSTRTEATKLTNQEVTVITTEASIRTRILKRSGSYADLTQNIKKDMKASEFEAMRSKVKDAVFEQWYFKKCAEEKERKLKQEKKEERLKKEKENKQKEVDDMSKEEFNKWCKEKKAKLEKEKKKKEIIEKGKVPKVVDKEEIERKNKEWLALKKKDFLKKTEAVEKKRLAEEAKKIEEDKKRTEAEKTFIAWKEAKTKELKERYLAEKVKQKEKEEALKDKRQQAAAVFIGWKNKKDEKIKDKTAKKNKDDKSKVETPKEDENNNEKLEQAKQAYESWLNLIEEREEENFLFEEERKRILMWKPPWYAGGKALF